MPHPVLRHLFGRTCRHDLSAALAAFWSHVNEIVSHLDDVEVMLDNHHGVSFLHQAVQDGDEHAYIFKVQSRGRLVENVERAPRVSFGEFRGELHALALAARKGGRRLSELDISQSHFLQHFDFIEYGRHIGKKLHSLIDGHVEHIADAFSLKAHLQCLVVVAFTLASLARHQHVGKEIHLDGLVAAAATRLAASALHVEGEASGLISAHLAFWQFHEELADVGKHARIGRRIGARRASDGTLVNGNHLVELAQSAQFFIFKRRPQRAIKLLRKDGQKRVVDERRLSATGNASDTHESAKRQAHRDILQIVALRADERELVAIALSALGWHLNGRFAVEILRRERMALEHLLGSTFKHHLAAQPPGFRPHVHHIIGGQHHVFVVFHDHHRVADVAQGLQRINETHVVALMKPDARLVEDVKHIDELRTDLRGKTDALALAAREGHGGARKRQIFKSNVKQELETGANFLQDFRGDGSRTTVNAFLHPVEPFIERSHLHRGKFVNILASEEKRQGFFIETRTVAMRAGGFIGELFRPAPRGCRHVGIGHVEDIVGQAVKLHVEVVCGVGDGCRHTQTFWHTIEYLVNGFLWQFLDGRVEGAVFIVVQDGSDFPKNQGVLIFPQRNDAALLHTEFSIEHLLLVDDRHGAESAAFRTSALRGVEREIMRCWLAV